MTTEGFTSIKGVRDAAEKVAHRALSATGRVIHACHISVARVLPAACVAPLALSGRPVAAVACQVSFLVADWLDGAVARAANQCSAEGARLDPLMDKVGNMTSLAILAYSVQCGYVLDGAKVPGDPVAGPVIASLALGSFGVNAFSEYRRGLGMERLRETGRAIFSPASCKPAASVHAANFWGKTKFFLESAAIGVLAGGQGSPASRWAAAAALVVSVGLGLKGVLGRPKAAVPASPRGRAA